MQEKTDPGTLAGLHLGTIGVLTAKLRPLLAELGTPREVLAAVLVLTLEPDSTFGGVRLATLARALESLNVARTWKRATHAAHIGTSLGGNGHRYAVDPKHPGRFLSMLCLCCEHAPRGRA